MVGLFVSKSKANREEKSLRHVAMVATFLDDNKTKTSLRSFKRHRSYSVSFNMLNLDKILWG